ncbi:DUF4083 domain-containing protein [Bacillus massiliigorillae]|uniref:DUF4083 domain-containing protein n=1 Tax=Bacillus massiliigorillae TaxID=1243664 RepID=UPI0003A47FAD|nr:DUF4083 domain-containing protein [Bacillus massiliigorillae]
MTYIFDNLAPIIFILLIIGALSFSLFIRRLLINTSRNQQNSNNIEEKLDKIIELLEKDKKC